MESKDNRRTPMHLATSARFSKLAERLVLPSEIVTPTFQLLEKNYTEPHRHYHNLQHIGAMLSQLPPDDSTTELAIWFHGVVYDSKAPDNEAESSRVFEECLGQSLDADIRADVMRLILATDYSQPRTGKPDEDLIRDLDLTVLAAEPAIYQNYRAAIRREYSHVPEKEFTVGRRRILMKFLAGRIYFTERFVSLESAARRNIKAELASVCGGIPALDALANRSA